MKPTIDAQTLGLRMMLIALLLRPVGGEWAPLFLGLAALGLLAPPMLRHSALWAALAVLAALRILRDWPLPDNHSYLLVYWCLACAIALAKTSESAVRLREAATVLIGLVFAFASLWKLGLSGDFLGGQFMRFTWLADERFADAARILGGLTRDDLEANRAFLGAARNAPDALVEPMRFRFFTGAATAFTAVIEPAIAVAYLWRGDGGPARLRTPLLLTFCATTFALAPVAGFAWLLLSMEAVRGEGSRRHAAAVVATFALVLAYRAVLDSGGWARFLS